MLLCTYYAILAISLKNAFLESRITEADADATLSLLSHMGSSKVNCEVQFLLTRKWLFTLQSLAGLVAELQEGRVARRLPAGICIF